MNEIWRTVTIDSCETLTMVSSAGNCRFMNRSNEFLNCVYKSSNGHNYGLIVFQDTAKRTLLPLEVLVASAFLPIPNINGQIYVKHINGDTTDNSVENLEWAELLEEWRIINNPDILENMYEVSNLGNIRKFSDKSEIQIHINNKGYKQCNLLRRDTNSKYKFCTKSLHRLIANAFFGRHDDMFVNHIDGNPLNCELINLELISPTDNTRHAVMLNLRSNMKFSNEDIDYIRKMLRKYIRPQIAYEHIDHEKYPYITPNTVKQVHAGKYVRSLNNEDNNFHVGKITVDEMDMVRDKLFEHQSNCRLAYDHIDHDKYPHITLQIVKLIKGNKDSVYRKSNRFDINKIKFQRSVNLGKFSNEDIDCVRELLNKYNGNCIKVLSSLPQELISKNMNEDIVRDIKRGRYKRSNQYNLEKSPRFPFVA